MINKNPEPSVLEGLNISKTYYGKHNKIEILKCINFSISPGKIAAITGVSGSGKSTLLHILGLLDIPDSGSIRINGIQVNSASEKQKDVLRNDNLGFVYQFHHLLPEFSILENVAMPLVICRQDWEKSEKRAKEVLSLVGLRKRLGAFPSELSGGECQRVAIARALIGNPICVLADEPTGNLDTKTARYIFDLLVQLTSELKTAFIIVTHDPGLASLADKHLIMENAKLLQKV